MPHSFLGVASFEVKYGDLKFFLRLKQLALF